MTYLGDTLETRSVDPRLISGEVMNQHYIELKWSTTNQTKNSQPMNFLWWQVVEVCYRSNLVYGSGEWR